MDTLKGKTALITGAGSGIGEATARRLAADGVNVILIGLGIDNVSNVCRSIQAGGGSAAAYAADVSTPETLAPAIAYGISTWGAIDILVTAAAAGPAVAPTSTLGLGDWNRVIATDLTGTFLSCQQVGRVMLENAYGRIITLGSFHVVGTYPERVAYVAAKSGVVGLTKSLAVEWGGKGITVNCISPGPIKTPRTQWFLSKDPANEKGMIGRTPRGALGSVDEVAATIAFLASKGAAHLNGQNLVLDGGWTSNAWWGRLPWLSGDER